MCSTRTFSLSHNIHIVNFQILDRYNIVYTIDTLRRKRRMTIAIFHDKEHVESNNKKTPFNILSIWVLECGFLNNVSENNEELTLNQNVTTN